MKQQVYGWKHQAIRKIWGDVLQCLPSPGFITARHSDCHPQIELQWLECTEASRSCREGLWPYLSSHISVAENFCSNIWRARLRGWRCLLSMGVTVFFLQLKFFGTKQKPNKRSKRYWQTTRFSSMVIFNQLPNPNPTHRTFFSIIFGPNHFTWISSYHLHAALSKGGPLAVTCWHLWYHATQPAPRMARTATTLVTQILQHGLHVAPQFCCGTGEKG